MPGNPIYLGGPNIGGEPFFVDGNMTVPWPCSLPRISFPFDGDSVFSNRDIMLLTDIPPDSNYPLGLQYIRVPYGTIGNIQPWSANQRAFLLEQDFMVAQGWFQAMALNSPYPLAYSSGWSADPLIDLEALILVKEGQLIDMGGGISRFTRTWASIPPTRNVVEQFAYNYIGLSANDGITVLRPRLQVSVPSRLQHDYFVFDDLNILAIPLFPNGPKLNAATGIYPDGIVIDRQKYFGPENFAEIDALFDAVAGPPAIDASTPNRSDYENVFLGGGVPNSYAEIVAEDSIIRQWMGNIYERVTRFVPAR